MIFVILFSEQTYVPVEFIPKLGDHQPEEREVEQAAGAFDPFWDT
jgi:hypothetical protein